MVDNFTVALKFESEGIPKTVADVKKITDTVADIRKQNELAAKSARILTEAYELTAEEAAQVQIAMQRAASETERASRTAAAESKKAREDFEKTAAVVSTGLAVGIGAFFNQAIEQFRQFEQFESILTNALGSPEAAEEALALIEQFAATTPFQLDEVVESFIKLQNRGISPTTEQLTQLGDIAASQGKSLDQVTEAILDAQTGEFERLKEFGIQASASGDQVAISFRDANLEVERTPEAIADAIFSLGELEGIAGGMAAQAETLTGRLSNLGDETSKASVAFGEFANTGVRPVVEGAILLVRSFNSLPAPLQAVVIGTTALAGALAAAVAAITAYNVANGKIIAQQALIAVNTIRNTAAVTAQGAALQVAAAAQATYATVTGQATTAQLAQTRALIGAGAALAAFAGAAGSLFLVADTFISLSRESQRTQEQIDIVRDSLDLLNQSASEAEPTGIIAYQNAAAQAAENVQALEERLGLVQRVLDRIRGTSFVFDTTQAEVNINRSIIKFNELATEVNDIILISAETANALEDGVTLQPGVVENTVASIDNVTAALEASEPVTAEAIQRRDAQIQKLQEYRDRITDTVEGVVQLTDTTDGLNDKLEELNDTLSTGQLAIQQAGTAAIAALEEQRAAGTVSAEEYQSQLANIERAGFNDRINLAQEKLIELQQLERAATDDEVIAQIQQEILQTQLTIDKDRIASARTRVEEAERLEQAQTEAAKKAAEERRDAAIKAAEEQTDALRDEREEQERIATEAFDTRQRNESQSFDNSQRQAEERFNDQQRNEDRRFQEQLQTDQSSFEDGQRSAQQAFENRQRSQQETFNQRQRDAEQRFQDQINAARDQGNREFDELDREVENRVALLTASSKEERETIEDRIEAEEEAADIRRKVEADVLRQRNSIIDDEDTELSPLEQARADFEADLQAQEQEFQDSQRADAAEFEDAQRLAKQEFEDGQRLAQASFEEDQRLAQQAFEDGQRQLENQFNENQRALDQQFEDQQRAAEAAFKANQRTLDEQSANRIADILENARNVGGQSLRAGGVAEGGVVQVHKDEFLLPPKGTRVVSQAESRRLIANYLNSGGSGVGSRVATAPVSSQAVERKLDKLIETVQQRPRPKAQATINMAPEATKSDAIKTAMQLQRAQFKLMGF